MTRANLEKFYQGFLQDRALQERFRTATNRDNMPALAVQLGKEKGYSFTTEEVQAYIDEMDGSPQEQQLSDEVLEAIAGGAGGGKDESQIVYGGKNDGCS